MCLNAIIVDIDETIVDTAYRKKAILETCFGISPTAEEIRNDYWLHQWLHTEEDQVLFFSKFHSSEYLVEDRPIPKAASKLAELSKLCKIIYLTGRHKSTSPMLSQWAGTVSFLRHYGFPDPRSPNVQLVMKDSYEGFKSLQLQAAEDLLFKRSQLAEIVCRAKVLWGITDSFSDLQVYEEFSFQRFCLKRAHFSEFSPRLSDIGPVTVLNSWAEVPLTS